MNKITICGTEVPIYYKSKEELNEIYKDSPVSKGDSDLMGLALVDELKIYIADNLHPVIRQKTIMHEAIHILVELSDEWFASTSSDNLHEALAVFTSNNAEEISNIYFRVKLAFGEW